MMRVMQAWLPSGRSLQRSPVDPSDSDACWLEMLRRVGVGYILAVMQRRGSRRKTIPSSRGVMGTYSGKHDFARLLTARGFNNS